MFLIDCIISGYHLRLRSRSDGSSLLLTIFDKMTKLRDEISIEIAEVCNFGGILKFQSTSFE